MIYSKFAKRRKMYTQVPFYLSILMVVAGLFMLYLSADKFIEGSVCVAKRLGVSPFIVGMLIVGFGTSAPEMCVSVMSGVAGHSELSLGNAYGSDIFNIAAILGITSLIMPIMIKKKILFFDLPLLLGVTIGSCLLFYLGGGFSRLDGLICLCVFAILLPIMCKVESKTKSDSESEEHQDVKKIHIVKAWMYVVVGLLFLIVSAHILVWGGVDLAREFGVSELMIGLTVVAIGTSLPELAAAIASARRGQSDLVVGIAGAISPFSNVGQWVFKRDLPVVLGLTVLLILTAFNFKDRKSGGCINRYEGLLLVLCYIVYSVFVVYQETGV